MSNETENALKDWQNEARDSGDDLHHHFSEYGRWDWCEISDEARRVWNLMFDEDIDDDSPKDGVWTAAAAQAAEGAFSTVAAALGVDAKAFQMAIAPWYENQDEPPPAVTAERLIELCNEESAWLLTRTPNAKLTGSGAESG